VNPATKDFTAHERSELAKQSVLGDAQTCFFVLENCTSNPLFALLINSQSPVYSDAVNIAAAGL